MKAVDILVADDAPHILRALSFIFSKEGLVVETARDGEEALAKCRTLTPRIAFFDLIMPKIDGIQLCRQIRADVKLHSPFIIILTCQGQDIDKELCLNAGADDFITKPFSPMEVLVKVRRILSG